MLKNDLFIQIIRQKKSFDFIIEKPGLTKWQKVRGNNAIDTLILLKKDKSIFKCSRVQTVANHPDYDFYDTIKPGDFQIRCFVKPRRFYGRVHGIINAMDIEGQPIGEYSMQYEDGHQKGRWCVHGTWSYKHQRYLHNAYSGGCIIPIDYYLEKFNIKLDENKVNAGDIINCNLKEI